MPGKRMIHDTCCCNMQLASVSGNAERLYWRMLSQTDDRGCARATPAIAKGHYLPLVDVTVEQTRDLLNELAEAGLISIYRRGREFFAEFESFFTYQKLRCGKPPEFKGTRGPSLWTPEPTSPECERIDRIPEAGDGSPVVNQWQASGKPTADHGQPVTASNLNLNLNASLGELNLVVSEDRHSSSPPPRKARRCACRESIGPVSAEDLALLPDTLSKPEWIIQAYNSLCSNLAPVREPTEKRMARSGRAVESQPSRDYWIDLFNRVNANEFLSGRSGRGRKWRASFDWLVVVPGAETNRARVLEGAYDQGSGMSSGLEGLKLLMQHDREVKHGKQ